MDTKLPLLTPAQWEVMSYCWEIGGGTVNDVLKVALTRKKPDHRTVLTLLKQCAGKGYITIEKIREPIEMTKKLRSGEVVRTTEVRNANFFRPAIDRKTALGWEIDRFLDDVVGDDPEEIELLIERARVRLSGKRKR